MKSQDQSSELWQRGTHVPGVAVNLTTDALFVKGLSVGTTVGVGDVGSITVKNVVPLREGADKIMTLLTIGMEQEFP